MKSSLQLLVQDLAVVSRFDEAAEITLRAMMEMLRAVLDGSPFARKGRILRGVVYWRPGDGYRHIYVRELESERESPVDETCLASMTAWQWISRARCPVFIDVRTNRLRPWADGNAGVKLPKGKTSTGDGARTIDHLQERNVTHVYVFPLRVPGGRLCGMISLEAQCQVATGKIWVDDDHKATLQSLADVVAPHLNALPMTEKPGTSVENGPLPVASRWLDRIHDMIAVFARQDETILLHGPTGAGKSQLARWVHSQSPRRKGPFEVVRLLSVPDTLETGRLFGWKKGSFTGADRDEPGSLGRACGGTLFIDEIDKLSLDTQATLLGVMDTGIYEPIGGDPRKADVRFVVATNIDLKAAVERGEFREDLYYRINVFPLAVPALSDRLDEIAGWATFMLDQCHQKGGSVGSARLTSEAIARLENHPWRGNLRELHNIIRRMHAFACIDHGGGNADLTVDDTHVERALSLESGLGDDGDRSLLSRLRASASAFVRELEQRGEALSLESSNVFRAFVILAAVEHCDGDRDRAFRLLGKANLVTKNRNHHREFKRATERIQELVELLSKPASGSCKATIVDIAH